ncbi:hypothetical protein [Burkholderia pseudomallei]|nr:hypothetical protein [Burkholderia pseudomallei]MBY7655920.1 hypothetical protein [Burkholderia pseudomallei]MDV2130279.1 hypothetical protein [Burkholderia pseudomallei]MDV2232784.1 hypothetical protein [Burkholderia pseudomallei]QUN85103.1 hypothetical protein KEX45_30395 [Burkholderia pseudomallei]QUN91047.1 hypothetical protein KEX46_30530 [Burkholderia pseudomallei]
MKFLENLDVAKVIRACGDFVVKLDAYPRGACFFVVVLVILCVSWRWR